eukprot:44941-Prymnesium_polylepis.1
MEGQQSEQAPKQEGAKKYMGDVPQPRLPALLEGGGGAGGRTQVFCQCQRAFLWLLDSWPGLIALSHNAG